MARGYEALTIEGVAERAGTSRAVLYRRWPGKLELVTATMTFVASRGIPEIPDTGSLRGDVLDLLRSLNTARAPLVTGIVVQIASYFRETGTSLADLRMELLKNLMPSHQIIFDRAIARGEVDPARLTPRIRSVPWDLVRHELIMTLKAVPDETIVEIVDEIFLPLVGVGCDDSPGE